MNYMTRHLLEAIKLNWQRLPKYSKLTGGKSVKISLLLIWSEVMSLISSFILDTIARYWQKRKVPVFVHEFIPMRLTPEFKSSYSFEVRALESFPAVKNPNKEFNQFIKNKDYPGLSLAITRLVEKLEEFPHVCCMTRHTLESFLRCSNLAPLHIKKASELGVKSPESFCLQVLKSHSFALGFCLFLDRLAFPVQNSGVPIICQDVPPIPPFPETY